MSRDHRSPEAVEELLKLRAKLGLEDPDNLALYLVQLFEGDPEVNALVLSKMKNDLPMGLDGEDASGPPGEIDLWEDDSDFTATEDRSLGMSISQAEMMAVMGPDAGGVPVPRARKVSVDPEVIDLEKELQRILDAPDG